MNVGLTTSDIIPSFPIVFPKVTWDHDSTEREAYEKELSQLKDRNSAAERLELMIKLSGGAKVTQRIIEIFGGVLNFRLNELPWNEEYLDCLGHIVNIKPSDMKDSLMWGIDFSGRMFIAAKIKIVNPVSSDSNNLSVIVFQHCFPKCDIWNVRNKNMLYHNHFPVCLFSEGISLIILFEGKPSEEFNLFQKLVNNEEIPINGELCFIKDDREIIRRRWDGDVIVRLA